MTGGRKRNRRVVNPDTARYYYPNRKLGFEWASSGDGLSPIAIGCVTLANLRDNEMFVMNGVVWRVGKVTDKTISFIGSPLTRINVKSKEFVKLAREVGDAIVVNCHTLGHKGLIEIFSKDPAARVDPICELIDNEENRYYG